MDSFVAIDPGVQYYGAAIFRDGMLTLARKESSHLIPALTLFATHCIIERPRKGGDKNSTRGDIQDLEYAAGWYAGHFATSKHILAYQVPKVIRHARCVGGPGIAAALTPAELAILPKQKGHLKHVLCAVYIGLKELHRV